MKFTDLNSAYEALLAASLDSSRLASPRGLATRELSNVFLTIEDPRARFITNPARRWSVPLAFGELAWHLSGSRDVDALASYAQVWRKFSSGSTIEGSCYGHKIFQPDAAGKNQWDRCKAALLNDPCTRRAVIQLYDPEQNHPGSRDVSCTLNVQFIARDGALDITVLMRSNDVYFGFPYDVFLYTNLQEMMAVELGLRLGTYSHFATSLHLYEKDASKAETVLRATPRQGFTDLPLASSAERREFCKAEASIRIGSKDHLAIQFSDEFWRQKYQFLADAHDGQRGRSFYSALLRD